MRTGSLAVRNATGSVAQSAVGTALPEAEGGGEGGNTRTGMRIRPGIWREITKSKRRRKGAKSEE